MKFILSEQLKYDAFLVAFLSSPECFSKLRYQIYRLKKVSLI